MGKTQASLRAVSVAFVSTSLLVGFGAIAQDQRRDLFVDHPRPLSEALLTPRTFTPPISKTSPRRSDAMLPVVARARLCLVAECCK